MGKKQKVIKNTLQAGGKTASWLSYPYNEIHKVPRPEIGFGDA